MSALRRHAYAWTVAATALGYFVDLYDIVIFGVVRVSSLRELGLEGQANTDWGFLLFNLQMVGMLIGGFFWGVIGDRYGRRAALIATIALYSFANIANAFVGTVEQYAVLRFIAGFGLAGELGAGVTLVMETLPKTLRGYGTTMISFLGFCGALAASILGSALDWRLCYFAGGVFGLAVLALRLLSLRESAMYESSRAQGSGNALAMLFGSRERCGRLLAVIAVGVPVWFMSALFVNFAPEYGRALGLGPPPAVAEVLRWQALGLALGSVFSGLAAERWQSRRKILLVCIGALLLLAFALLTRQQQSVFSYVELMFVVGMAQGYWTVYLATAAEQFGTNLRATVTTAVPNLVRAVTVPVTLLLQLLMPRLGLIAATMLLALVFFGLGFFALWRLRETWGRDLDYRES